LKQEEEGCIEVTLSAEGPCRTTLSEAAVPDEPHPQEKQACHQHVERRREGEVKAMGSQLVLIVLTTPSINTLQPNTYVHAEH